MVVRIYEQATPEFVNGWGDKSANAFQQQCISNNDYDVPHAFVNEFKFHIGPPPQQTKTPVCVESVVF